MWTFRIYFYDPELDAIRTFKSEAFFPTFLEACLAVDLSLQFGKAIMPQLEDTWIIQDIDIFEELFLGTKEES